MSLNTSKLSQKGGHNLFWKIYSWFISFLTVICVVLIGIKGGLFNAWRITDFIVTTFEILGLISFAYKKRIFRVVFWEVYFFIAIAWDISYIFLIEPIFLGKHYSLLVHSLSISISLPVYIALYLYSFRFFATPVITSDDLLKETAVSEEQQLKIVFKNTLYMLGIVITILIILIVVFFGVALVFGMMKASHQFLAHSVNRSITM